MLHRRTDPIAIANNYDIGEARLEQILIPVRRPAALSTGSVNNNSRRAAKLIFTAAPIKRPARDERRTGDDGDDATRRGAAPTNDSSISIPVIYTPAKLPTERASARGREEIRARRTGESSLAGRDASKSSLDPRAFYSLLLIFFRVFPLSVPHFHRASALLRGDESASKSDRCSVASSRPVALFPT